MGKLSVLFITTLFCVACSASGRPYIRRNKLILRNGKVNLPNNVADNASIIKNDDDLFIISTGKNIIKISQKNNAIVWVKKISTVPLDNFSFDEKYVYFNGINGTFYMLNYDTGKIEYIYLNANSTTILDVKKPVIHKNIVIVFVKNRVILFDKINKQILADEYCKNIENVVVSDDTVNIDGTMVSI